MHLLCNYTGMMQEEMKRKLIDEVISGTKEFPDKRSAWTKAGFLEAVKILLTERNTLFESLTGKLYEYPELKNMLYTLLFQGQSILYSPDNATIDMATMFGFVKNQKRTVEDDNRIFETRLYNLFLTMPEAQETDLRIRTVFFWHKSS